MGQKVNPIGIRLKINRTWDSVWFAKKQNYGTYLIEDFKIRKYINKTIKNSGVSKILIENITLLHAPRQQNIFSIQKKNLML